jgi:hypothetical protein
MSDPKYIRQLAVTWPEEWQRLEAWYRSRGFYLFRIPDSEDADGHLTYSKDGDHIPTYGVGIADQAVTSTAKITAVYRNDGTT